MWYVYLLECSDGSLYCGITNDINRRVDTHNKGKGAKYTKTRLPVKIFYTEGVSNKSEAAKREYQIKKMSRENKLKLKTH